MDVHLGTWNCCDGRACARAHGAPRVPLSVLLSVFAGGALFGERNVKWRLIGACIMVLGTALILIWG